MAQLTHPNDALFAGEKPYPIINVRDHFADSEKLIGNALVRVTLRGRPRTSSERTERCGTLQL